MHLSRKLRSLGWILVFPDYQFLPEATAWDIRQDVLDLEKWMIKEQKTYGFDLDRIAVTGTSAGEFTCWFFDIQRIVLIW
jgi:acetyl esterase/lipase